MSLVVAIFFFIMGATVTAAAFYKEYKSAKKMTGFKWFLIVAFVLFVSTGIWQETIKSADSKQDKIDIQDTTKKTGKTLGRKIDTGFKGLHSSVNHVDSDVRDGFKGIPKKVKINYFAQIGWTATEDGQNPVIIKTKHGDSLTMKVTNYGTGVAFDVSSISFFIYVKNGMFIIQTLPVVNKNYKYLTYYPTSPAIGYAIHAPYNESPVDSAFLCFKLDYSDSTKKRKSFNQILKIKDRYNFTTFDNDFYIILENYLIKNKYWTSPFKQ